MNIVSTGDIRLDLLRDFASDLGSELPAEVSESQIQMRAAEAPSWIALLADADVWVKVLGASAALFVAEIVKEVAKETWRNRAKAVAAGSAALGRISKLVSSIVRLEHRLSGFTTVAIGLPIPNDYFSTKLPLDTGDPAILQGQIALFIHHLPAVVLLIKQNGLGDGQAGTGIFLELQDDGSMLVSWHDRNTLEIRRVVLPLTPTMSR